jgi:hypothetical protein
MQVEKSVYLHQFAPGLENWLCLEDENKHTMFACSYLFHRAQAFASDIGNSRPNACVRASERGP